MHSKREPGERSPFEPGRESGSHHSPEKLAGRWPVGFQVRSLHRVFRYASGADLAGTTPDPLLRARNTAHSKVSCGRIEADMDLVLKIDGITESHQR
jgi:hypothetical protein